MGQPDQIIYMSDKPFQVPAEGAVAFQTFTVDPGWTTDKWIQATEARPGNRAVVHHLRVEARPANVSDAFQREGIGLYAPGFIPNTLPEGTAIYVAAHSKLVFQLHYQPNGAPQEDRSLIGIRFADPRSVKKMINATSIESSVFKIPAGHPNYAVKSTELVMKDMLLLSMTPHMHSRGKAFKLEAEYADGRSELLLDVPNYDFNWQLRYIFAEPRLIPKGTRLHCTGYFDNSADNLSNPDPTKDVLPGNETNDEMMQGNYYALDREPDAACLALVAQTLGGASNASRGSLRDELEKLLDFGEKNTPSAVAVARVKYQQLKASHPEDRRLDYAMALVLANQRQYADAIAMLARYLDAGPPDPSARCAKMWVEALTQRFAELAADARTLADELPRGEQASPDERDLEAARFLGVVTAYLERVRPRALDPKQRAADNEHVGKRIDSIYRPAFDAGQKSVSARLGELQKQDQEYADFLAEVEALKDDAPDARAKQPAAESQAELPETPSTVDTTMTSFSNYANFPYDQERQRVVSWYSK
jgi:hypothetical protein